MLTNALTGLNQGGWDLGMGCGELLTSLAEARVQGAAENPVGLAPEALEPGFPKCIWGFFLLSWTVSWPGHLPQRRPGAVPQEQYEAAAKRGKTEEVT